jgi:phosphomannomutase
VKHAIRYPSEKIDVLFRKAEKIFSDGKISYTDGIKIDFENRWVSIRRSGTESIVRIFAEAKTEKEATTLINRLLCAISSCKSF